MHTNALLTLCIFTATLIVMICRPRGVSEAWAAAVGGGLMLLCRQETWKQALETVTQGTDVLVFLLMLMLLSSLLEISGLFDWAAIYAARLARGSGRALFRNIYCLGAITTALLSLDTTAIILTPIVIACVKRLGLPSRGVLISCALVANAGSLLLPVSNLTNLLFQSQYRFKFGQFAEKMLLPEIAALVVSYGTLVWLSQRDLPTNYDIDELPQANSVVPDQPFFRTALLTLAAILIGYFAASAWRFPAYLITGIGVLVLLTAAKLRKRINLRPVIGKISWSLFVFVIGLFVVVRGVENLNVTAYAAQLLSHAAHSPLLLILGTAFGAGLGSNVVNNIPMALIALSVIGAGHYGSSAVYGALIGCNIGPNLTVIGSLATMLVITSAKARGESISGMDFLRVGIIAAPLSILAACLLLYLEFRL